MDDGASRESRREEYDTITHVAKRGEQLDTLSQPALSLTRRYARNSKQGRYRAYNAKQPADGFHWRMIADATFGTHGQSDARARGVINRHLKSIGAPRVGANYALKPGMELKIPFQKKTTRVEEISRPTKPWWEALLEQDNPDFGTLATKRGEDGKMGHVPKFMPRAEFDAMIQRGRYLREVFREFYRPEEGAGGGLQVAMPRNSEWPRQAQFPNLARKHR